MKHERIINGISNLLTILLENASEDKIDNKELSEFYTEAQNLKESINKLNLNQKNKKRDPGLYSEEVMELMNYIQKNNSWQNMLDCHNRHREIPKYYIMRVDTRTGTVWSIEFDHLIYEKENKKFRTEQDYNFKDTVYEFLDRERKNNG